MGMIQTFAQSGTATSIKKASKPQQRVYGNGSDLTNEKRLKNKAMKKLITSTLSLKLVDIAKADGNYIMEKVFWRTYHCHEKIITSGGLSYGYYCKNRFCLVCSGNRRAELIRKYLPVLETWKEPYFVTLTVRAPKAEKLDKFMNGVLRAFNKIHLRIKQRHKRGKGIKLVGIKSVECNFNPKSKTYNPHIHLIVENKEMAELLKKEWLSIWTTKYTYHEAQKLIPITDKEKILIEVIKYSTKVFTEPDPKNKTKKRKTNEPVFIYTAAMYNVIVSMRRLRLFERFGFNLPPSSLKPTKSTLVTDITEFEYDSKLMDWTNKNGVKLTNYLPDSELIAMLANNFKPELK